MRKSPLAFVIYVSDLEDWLEFAISLTHADDTSTSVSADKGSDPEKGGYKKKEFVRK